MSDKCVCNYAKGSWYPNGQIRLKNSFLSKGYDGDFFFCDVVSKIGCPSHTKVPYAFKPYLLKQAMDKGYRYILWCDAAVWLVGDIDRIWERLNDVGYILVHNGWNTGQWCSDRALATLGITREESFQIPHLMANMMGFDLSRPFCRNFINQYYEKANDGVTFLGAWSNKNHEVSSDDRVLGHRHDQTAASVIAWRLCMMDWLRKWTSYNPDSTDPEVMFKTHPAPRSVK